MYESRRNARRYRRRGATVALVALSLVTLTGFAALSVDVGYLYTLHGDMQRCVDASALAGAGGLRQSHGNALADAQQYAKLNPVNKEGVSPDELEVTIGNWEQLSQSFGPFVSGQAFKANAVRVVGHRANVAYFFAQAIGFKKTSVQKNAVAVLASSPCSGIWGLEGITVDGEVVTDSYNSQEGPYGSRPLGRNGDLCSCQDVALNGSVTINGDVMNGIGYNLIIEGVSHEIWGTIGVTACSPPTPVFDVSAVAASNDNARIPLTDRGRDPFNGSPYDLNLSSFDNLTLLPGDYYLTSALVEGRATITVTGTTRIYVDGPASFAGNGFINTTNDPHALTIFSEGSTITVTGTSGFVGSVIAPNSDVILPGGSEYFGLIIGRTVDLDGSVVIHIDESLMELYETTETYALELVD